MTKRVFLILFLVSLLIVWPAIGASSPSWMGVADGFVLAKARFLSDGFGLGSWNRYWFLGIPGQHIGSPVIPWILSLVTVVTGTVPVTSPGVMFGVWRGMVALGVVGSVLAAGWFARGLILSTSGESSKLSFENKKAQLLYLPAFVAFFILLMPSVLVLFPQIWGMVRGYGWPSWTMFAPFYLGDGQRTLAFGLVIVGAAVGWRLVKQWKLRNAVVLSFLAAVILLVDALSFVTLLLWLISFLLVSVIQPRLRKNSIIILSSRLLSVLVFGLLLGSFWFTPGYIYTVLGSPSLGGKPFTLVVINLLRRVLIFLPALLGVIAARRWLRKSPTAVIVGLMGLLVFGSLTFAAFFADPDFWTDYSRFGRSLDLSLALLVGGFLYSDVVKSRLRLVALLVGIFIVGMPFLLKRGALFGADVSLSETSEYRVGSELQRLIQERCPTSKASGCPVQTYLSGSSVFWLNGWFDISQVRGGGEMGSMNDWWPHASYQIREGRSPELAEAWLEALGASFLVVHGVASEEVYHDFRFPSKFDQMEGWNRVWDERGDVIYGKSKRETVEGKNIEEEIPGTEIARIVDLDILKLASPKKGDDLAALRRYTEMLGPAAEFSWEGTRELEVSADVESGEGMRLAVSYSPFWRVVDSSFPVEIVKDPLGMIVLRPSREGAVSVRLRFAPWMDLVGGTLITAASLYVLLRRPQVLEKNVAIVERLIGRESDLDRTAL